MTRPAFHHPMLATLVDTPVEGDEWIFERKFDGIRLIIVRDGSTVRLVTRNQHQHTDRYPELRDALLQQESDQFVVDGEVVAFEGNQTSFARLQGRSGITDPRRAMATGIAVKLYLFDIMHLDGEDTTSHPLRERKKMLRRSFDFADPIRFSAHRNADGQRFFAKACRDGWEGLIAKRASSRYKAGRSRDWLKLKCVRRQELVVGGFSSPKGSRARFGALLLGYYSDGRLIYAGRVGTGFDRATLQRLGDELEDRERSDPPFVDPPRDGDVRWVEPELVCDVEFTEWTTDGMLRHPRYVGLRDDKTPKDVVREVSEQAP